MKFTYILFYLLQTSHALGLFNPYANSLNSVELGPFTIIWDDTDPYIEIMHTVSNKLLFHTLPLQPFVTIGYATDSKPPIVDGNFKVNEWTLFETPYQDISKVTTHRDQITIHGEVWGLVTKASYQLKFHIDQAIPNQLFFNLTANPITGSFNRLFLNYGSDSSETFHGFGVQYTHWNLKGLRVPIVVAEQGIGRGLQPLTSILNVMADRTGGDPLTTYAPKPLYLTSHCRSMVFDNSQIMFFDLRDANAVVVELWGSELIGSILYGENMLDLITEVTILTGRMSPLPDWTQVGAIVGLEGGTEEVEHQVNDLLDHRVQLAGVWLQDWVGLRHAYDGDRLMWNWVLDPAYYPNWNNMVDNWAKKGIRVLTYINSFFSDPIAAKSTSSPTNPNAVLSSEINENGSSDKEPTMNQQHRNLFQEGLSNKYFVQNKYGESYRLHSGSIEFCMLDTTNPAARLWMKNIIKYEMIRDTSSSGWMADFGEYLPFDAVLHNGMNPAEYHNIYPQEWAKINQEAIAEAKLEGVRQKILPSNSLYENITKNESISNLYDKNNSNNVIDSDVIYFMRSAWLKSPQHTALFWLGDQLVSWDAYDGIKTVVIGAMSGGLGGHSLTHSDIGGYTMQDVGPFPNVRTRELLYRWIELEAFGSAIFRSHIGSLVSPKNVQIYHDKETMLFFGKFTHIFQFLATYRKVLMQEANEKGWPLIRSLAAHYGEDPNTWSLSTQYMFGDQFIIAPVMDPMKNNYNYGSKTGMNSASFSEFADMTVRGVKVYIPAKTTWIHLWTGQQVYGGEKGRYVSVDAPFGCPPVFYTTNSVYGANLRDFIVKNHYEANVVLVNPSEKNPSSLQKQQQQDEEKSIHAMDHHEVIRPKDSDNINDNDNNVVNLVLTESEIESIILFSDSTTTSTSSSTSEESTSHTSTKHVALKSTQWFLEKPLVGRIVPYTDYWSWYDWLGISQYLAVPDTNTQIIDESKSENILLSKHKYSATETHRELTIQNVNSSIISHDNDGSNVTYNETATHTLFNNFGPVISSNTSDEFLFIENTDPNTNVFEPLVSTMAFSLISIDSS